ncbi:hypothetical protein CC85DRAFT_78645 [Cutaneotrichosporon oleaginosum]|uniref:Uncharacterized protein n=1 Tax=Cutaneotrichosporon oleaginosum TaxID=879819 RepID=A0A0J0XNU0_9TREE|nr:uncharacterized protein CC85DRAFT_78645 [Cutaneotrichosporon oleaginosum]KLT42757.1 hypothetical protein CC85DRAFT_78645 [Cutaneotrichosporon oleaginosum]TXT09524.1 hypothetical protein COLE_03458 [Cutaneotrichosporon oleaginosum]
MSTPHSPAWRHTKTFPYATQERTGNEPSLRERRGLDALPSPRPPFSYSRSANTTPRSAHHDLHTSASSTSIRPPQSPAPSLTPSMASLTPSQAPSFTPSFTPSFAQSTDSRRGLFRRTHRVSTSISPPTSISISQTQWQPAMPSAILSGEDQRPAAAPRSVSDSVMPTLQLKPKLQRKKSNASLLYQGLGRGLSRPACLARDTQNLERSNISFAREDGIVCVHKSFQGRNAPQQRIVVAPSSDRNPRAHNFSCVRFLGANSIVETDCPGTATTGKRPRKSLQQHSSTGSEPPKSQRTSRSHRQALGESFGQAPGRHRLEELEAIEADFSGGAAVSSRRRERGRAAATSLG